MKSVFMTIVFEKDVSTLYKLESSLPNGFLTTAHLSSALSDLLDETVP